MLYFSRFLCLCEEDTPQDSRRVHLSAHTCVGIRVFSLRRGFRTILWLTAQSPREPETHITHQNTRNYQVSLLKAVISSSYQILACFLENVCAWGHLQWRASSKSVRVTRFVFFFLFESFFFFCACTACPPLRVWEPVWAQQRVTQPVLSTNRKERDRKKRGAGRREGWVETLEGGGGRNRAEGFWFADTFFFFFAPCIFACLTWTNMISVRRSRIRLSPAIKDRERSVWFLAQNVFRIIVLSRLLSTWKACCFGVGEKEGKKWPPC